MTLDMHDKYSLKDCKDNENLRHIVCRNQVTQKSCRDYILGECQRTFQRLN
jgi:hypothetical protein